MEPTKSPKYILSSGTQVREEDFGLLFYTMKGPHLYFCSSGQLMGSSFFQGELTLDEWIRLKKEEGSVPEERIGGIKKSLDQLKDKGVIFEC
jgi:putative mycofactocin binding protein MftB